ncbi:MAG: secondary thiamine-phosphate synthase enzyme YjbQ [Syntrophales bacterium]|nr:secondary thiamine-phosphate synthase enzyme YjbQ [Syntrophales bacterium]MDD5643260.1 secondary thiamine-phosphate synthase enzyme YjbQ [Syntrophales bacterium]
MFETLTVPTNHRTELLDLTSQVQQVVHKSGVSEGLCHVFVPHTTAAVTINESADPAVKADILMVLNKIISDQEPYRHQEGNSPAHLKSSIIGCQITVLVSKGRLVLGTWQGIFFCEFDGPRSRRLHVKVVAG